MESLLVLFVYVSTFCLFGNILSKIFQLFIKPAAYQTRGFDIVDSKNQSRYLQHYYPPDIKYRANVFLRLIKARSNFNYPPGYREP